MTVDYTKSEGDDIKMKKLIFVILLASAFIGCRSVSTPRRAINDSGMMYSMVYDHENSPVYGATVFIDGRKRMESDLQGRFVMELKRGGRYRIKLEKPGYEVIEDTFTYDPMNVLYFKMVNTSQLILQAEEAMDQYAYAEAEALINRALKLEPNRPDVLYFLSIVFYYQGRNAEAITILEDLQSRGIGGEYITNFLNILSG